MTANDIVALGFFLFFWLGFEFAIDHSSLRYKSMSGIMERKRREWMLTMADRDLRMIDTTILRGLQSGASFFGSVSVFAIGGCFALLSSTEVVLNIFSDLQVADSNLRAAWELKIIGLTAIFVYSFFKFGWSYRLFNYCSILVGAVQMVDAASLEVRQSQALTAAKMNAIASKHFTAGIRAIFFACGYLGWLIGPKMLMATTLCVVVVLLRRQFFSKARQFLIESEERETSGG